MSLRNFSPDFEVSVPQGLDTTSPLTVMKPGFIRVGANVNLGLDGGYVKRDGYTSQLVTPYGSLKITQGIEYKSSSGLLQEIIFGTNGLAGGGSYGYINSGAVVDISTGLSGIARPYFVQFGSLLFFYNGIDNPQLYDGTSVRQIGITLPSIAPTVSSQTTGGQLTLTASYIYAYTYYNSATGAESSPSPFSDPIVLTGVNDQIIINVTPGDATTADMIKVYRTVGNGNALFLDGTTSISATTYDSTISDAGLGRQIELDNSRITDLTSTAQFPIISDNRVFVKSGINEIRFSKFGQLGPMPESFEVKSVVPTIGRHGDNDDIVGINRITQLPIVLKESSVGRLDPFGLPDVTQAVDNVGYTYREISDTVGGLSHAAAIQVLGELVFLAKDNIYATDGTTVRQVGNDIQATIRSLGFTSGQRPRISAINDNEHRRIYFEVFSAPTKNNPDMIIVGDYQLYPTFRWTFYQQGSNPTTWPGITASCFFHVTNPINGQKDVWWGNSAANGKLYRMNDGTNDDGSAIYMQIVTRPYFGNEPLFMKLFKKTEFQGQGNGANYNLTVCSIYDLSGVEQDCLPLSLMSNGSIYDDPSSLYDTTVWADESISILSYFMHHKAKYLQLSIKQLDVDAPVDLFSWGVYESIFNPNEGPKS